jgi:hypothetical protein
VASSSAGGGAGEQQDLRHGWAPRRAPVLGSCGVSELPGEHIPVEDLGRGDFVVAFFFWNFLSFCYSKSLCKIFIKYFFHVADKHFKKIAQLICENFLNVFLNCFCKMFIQKFLRQSFVLRCCSRYFLNFSQFFCKVFFKIFCIKSFVLVFYSRYFLCIFIGKFSSTFSDFFKMFI